MAATQKPVDFHPPKAVQKALARGLGLKAEYGGAGLQEGTVRWAEHLSAGKPSEPAQALRMRAWFHRHKVDKKQGWDNPPTPGYVAWLLWGGDAGQKWAEKLAAQVEAQGLNHDEPAKNAAGGPRKAGKKARAKAAKKTHSNASKKARAKAGKKAGSKTSKKVRAKAGKKVGSKASKKVRAKAGKKARAKAGKKTGSKANKKVSAKAHEKATSRAAK